MDFSMNPDLFLAFLMMTVVLIITPGPVVTLVVATGATDGMRAALLTVFGTTLGNALLIAAVAFGLNFVLASSARCLISSAMPEPPTSSGSVSDCGAKRERTLRYPPRRADAFICRVVFLSRCPTRKRRPFSPHSCRNSSIPRCPPGSSSR
jgi:hypothetical protein